MSDGDVSKPIVLRYHVDSKIQRSKNSNPSQDLSVTDNKDSNSQLNRTGYSTIDNNQGGQPKPEKSKSSAANARVRLTERNHIDN
jgi:Tfp pilus assembly protein PilV